MEFSGLAKDTAKNVADAIDYILTLPISLNDKRARITKVLKIVGDEYHIQAFSANSQVFGSEALKSLGVTDASQAGRLSTKIVRNYGLGREVSPLILDFYNSLLGQAQIEAFDNAVSMQRNPRVDRSLVGEKNCSWCSALAGSYSNPRGEVFARHARCDCLIRVSGYNTRNGLLSNYVKVKN